LALLRDASYPVLVPGWIGIPELLVLLLVILLVFGPKRLPEMGRSLGRGMREFKDSITGDKGRDEERGQPELTSSTPAVEEHPVGVAQQRSEEREQTS
jgi:sec-independent protein translocase protein TatA